MASAMTTPLPRSLSANNVQDVAMAASKASASTVTSSSMHRATASASGSGFLNNAMPGPSRPSPHAAPFQPKHAYSVPGTQHTMSNGYGQAPVNVHANPAMYAAAYYQQQQHFRAQMAAMQQQPQLHPAYSVPPQNPDPRRRLGSFDTSNPPQMMHHTSQSYLHYQPQPHMLQLHGQQSPQPPYSQPYPQRTGSPSQHSPYAGSPQAYYPGMTPPPQLYPLHMPPPQAPFAMNHHGGPRSSSPSSPRSANGSNRSASPAANSSSRLRTGSQPGDSRNQPPHSAYPAHRDRTDSSSSAPTRATQHPHNVYAQPGSASSSQTSLNQKAASSFAPQRFGSPAGHSPSPSTSSSRSRTDSQSSMSARPAGFGRTDAGRSASPTASDRAPTPTALASPHTRVATSSATRSPATVSVSISSATRPKSPSPLAGPVSGAQSTRSITPTQSRIGGKATAAPRESIDSVASDDTALEKPSGHRSAQSNASSANASEASGASSQQRSASPGGFKSKLRKALSLSDINKHISPDAQRANHGRTSLNSESSSDTSHSTLGPQTPPNGVSPVIPNGYASASTTSLHTSRKPGPLSNSASAAAGSSMPTGSGSRRFGLLNSKLNSSSDNLSISSTVSSASMMLRKIGSLGKLGRKSSVRSLSNIFQRNHAERDAAASDRSDAVSEFGVPGAAISASKNHARHQSGSDDTQPGDSVANDGISPAEAFVRKHQEREKAEEARKVAVESATSSMPIISPRSKFLEKEKERLKAANKDSKPKKKWGISAFSRNKNGDEPEPTTSAFSSASESPATSSAPSPIVPQGNDDAASSSASSVNEEVELQAASTSRIPSDWRPSLDGIQLDSWRKADAHQALREAKRELELEADSADEPDDRTPRQSMEFLQEDAPLMYDDWNGEPPSASFFDDDTASFSQSQDDTHNTVATAGRLYQEEQYEDGGHDGRSGQPIPPRPSPQAQPERGILKHSRSYAQEQMAPPHAAFSRARASSYDAPQQTTSPNRPGELVALAQILPSEEQIDGTVGHAQTAPRQDVRPTSPTSFQISHPEQGSISSSSSHQHMPFNHPSFNSSEPLLHNAAAPKMQARAMTSLNKKRNISFAQNLSVHTTWSGTIYDRRGEPATCNRLTPALAQRIKEELNTFKLEEMEVHHLSRDYTHFFV